MALITLPFEILGSIAKETLPEGFESFALSCRPSYLASKRFIEQHNKLKRRYRSFRSWRDDKALSEEYCTTSMQLIARIAEEPLIARYIVSADLRMDVALAPSLRRLGFPGGPLSLAEADNSDFPNAQFYNSLKKSSKIYHLLESSAYLRQAAVDPSILQRYMVSEYDEGFGATITTCFLLTLLPNVTTLALPEHFSFQSRQHAPSAVLPDNIYSLVNLISDKANNLSDQSASLSKLTTILPNDSWGVIQWSDLRCFTPLLRTRSVREFYYGSCTPLQFEANGRFGPLANLNADGLGLGLEVIELPGAVFESHSLHEFLSGMPRLRSLKFSHQPGFGVEGGENSEWDASIYMAAIEDAVGDRLEELSFSVVDGSESNENGITSMKGFAKLKCLELDVAQLITSPHEPMPAHWKGNELARRWNLARQTPRLCDLLPPTMEELSLLTDGSTDSLITSFALLASIEGSLSELPNLQEITVCGRFHTKLPEISGEILSSSEAICLEVTTTKAEEDPTMVIFADIDRLWGAAVRRFESSRLVKFVPSEFIPAFMEEFRDRFEVD